MAGDTFKTPLGRVRGMGSAKQGTGHFIKQRVTAIANVPLMIAFVAILIATVGGSYDDVIQTMGHPIVSLIMIAVIVSAVIHMRLGMQVIIEDYISGKVAKAGLLVGNAFFTAAIGLVSVFALLKIAFGG